MLDGCPGTVNLRIPTLVLKKCPHCGREVEIFSNDISVKYSRCGFIVYNNVESCIRQCKYAKECVGEDMYNKLMVGWRTPPSE